MERNIFIVKSVELHFHWIIVYRSTHQHTLEKNLFNLKTVELNLPRIHISEHTCHCTLERSFFFFKYVKLYFHRFQIWKRRKSTHTKEKDLLKTLLLFTCPMWFRSSWPRIFTIMIPSWCGLLLLLIWKSSTSKLWVSLNRKLTSPTIPRFGYHWTGDWPVPQHQELTEGHNYKLITNMNEKHLI